MLQFKEYITPYFKIDLNISVICKTIKVEIPATRNENTNKKDNTDTHKGDNKNKTKDTKL